MSLKRPIWSEEELGHSKDASLRSYQSHSTVGFERFRLGQVLVSKDKAHCLKIQMLKSKEKILNLQNDRPKGYVHVPK